MAGSRCATHSPPLSLLSVASWLHCASAISLPWLWEEEAGLVLEEVLVSASSWIPIS